MMFSRSILVFLVFIITISTAQAELEPNNKMINKWNQFVDDLMTLSQHLTSKSEHSEKKRSGSYSNLPDFYHETKYIHSDSETVTSIVQMETENPENVHSIQVYLRDKNGRVMKDFSGSYLTTHHNAPIQTLITLHYYNDELHAFRVFDASHERLYEICRGKLDGKQVNIDIDDDYGELSEALEDKQGIMSSAEYKACFGSRDYDKSRLQIPLNF
ncbi:MAG: hypothetical protein OEY36_12100 [Gammaproteobacteria bacterium]|nr:hypothetical protein [Gammaproteobacteria bacterium]